jgi:ribosome assembly protein 1
MLAHVDHGKSALSDALIAANGIISERSAGKVRYMDSREDEQRRGITMKSSSIALAYRPQPSSPLAVINLVDSPGHCDFSGEVEAALRVCDGAVLVVDVVEGVCVQTVTVLRAALERGVRPVLILNKLDRLFVELQLNPAEAYQHILRVLEQVNVIMGLRQVEDMMARADIDHGIANKAASGDGPTGMSTDWKLPDVDDSCNEDDSVSGYFSPERGNVAFASAIDGWAFRLDEFAALFSQKFGISKPVLMKTLWGNYYLQPKAKRIVRKRASDSSAGKTMFVQFVLTSLHSVYDAVYSSQHDMVLAINRREKIAAKLGLKISNRDLRHKDASIALHSIMNAWMPAAPALLSLITDQLPSTAVAQRTPERLAVLWPNLDRPLADESSDARAAHQRASIEAADPAGPLLAYVTKMLEPVNAASSSGGRMNIRLPKSRLEMASKADVADSSVSDEVVGPTGREGLQLERKNVGGEESDGLVAFARLMSGTISVGDRVYVYGPRYAVAVDGTYDETAVESATVTSLFLLMGRDMEHVSQATAGSIVGIAGLSSVILKTATVSSLSPGTCLPLGQRSCVPYGGSGNDAAVRVAVEPHLPGDVLTLQNGLRKLNQADPAVDTYVTSKGEHVIAASGELHLERCLLDLRDRFAKGIEIHVSAPIISFRETVIGGIPPAAASDILDSLKTTGLAPSPPAAVEDTGSGSCDTFRVNSDCNGAGERKQELLPSMTSDTSAGWRMRFCKEKGCGSRSLSPLSLASSSFVKHGRRIEVGNSVVSFSICAAPIPIKLAAALDKAGKMLRVSTSSVGDLIGANRIDELRDALREAAQEDAVDGAARVGLREQFVQFWTEDVLSHVWSCGPRRFGSNILVGPTISEGLMPWMTQLLSRSDGVKDLSRSLPTRAERELEKAIATGFQLGALAGPLCEEPLHGVAFFVDSVLCRHDSAPSSDGEAHDAVALPSSITGLVIGTTKEAIRAAVLHANPRIMEAALRVEVSVSGDALGGTYTALGKRRGRVVAEEMKDGVNIFSVEAIMPQTESFGFSESLRKQTSGFASAQMVFSHWETVDVDPFWTPRTEEELEDVGLENNTEASNNLARKLVNGVRKRKGLRMEEKIVEKAEKQRTLTKNK